MVSASALINTILTTDAGICQRGSLKDVQLILYMNLADYSFSRNEDTTAVSEESDRMYEVMQLWQQDMILRGLTSGNNPTVWT